MHHASIDTCALNCNAMERARVFFVLVVKIMARFSGACEDIRGTLRSLGTRYVYVFKIQMNKCVSFVDVSDGAR